MKDSEIYLKAAKSLHAHETRRNGFTNHCQSPLIAIAWLGRDYFANEANEEEFESVFGFETFRKHGDRVLALCFMAAIAASEGR